MDNIMDKVIEYCNLICEKAPVIECITNNVTINDCANVLLAVGAKPTMACHIEEVSEVASNVSALVLNMGAIANYDAMIIAGRSAKANNHPVVLDPVGISASSYRRNMCLGLIKEVHPDCIRGNKSEILALIQDCNTAKGVDSDTEISEDILINKMKAYAQAEHMLLIASGATDIITDGNTVILNDLGHKLMKKITGAGCMSSCIIAPFLCINNTIESAYLATALMGYAANEAAEYVISNNGGTITFRNELINSISRINLLN